MIGRTIVSYGRVTSFYYWAQIQRSSSNKVPVIPLLSNMPNVRDLATLAPEELKEFLNSFDTVLCDVDGVILYNNEPVPGAPKAIETLRKLGKKVIFVSNNCLRTHKDFHSCLQNLGFDTSDGLITPSACFIDYLRKQNFQKKIFLFTLHGLRKELAEAGFKIVNAHDVKIEGKNPLELLLDIEELDPDVGAVYFDIDVAFNYIALQKAIQYLKKPEVQLFGSGTDKIIPASQTLKLIGPGYFFQIFKEMTGKEPLIFGKPGNYINEFVKPKLTSPSRTLFIGDAMEQDVRFANTYGYRSLLVLSGTSTKEQLASCTDSSCIPTNFIQDLKTFQQLITKSNL